MLKREKNCFIKLCNKLEYDYLPYENEITYVRKYLIEKLKISKDIDKLLKLKAEGEEMNYDSNFSINLSLIALILSVLNIYPQLIENGNDIEKTITLIMIMFILIAYRIFTDELAKSKHFKKWRKYVLCVINQLIEENREEIKSKKHKKLKENKS